MEIGVVLMAGGLLLAPLTTQPWHLYLTIGVMVGGGSICLGYSGQSLFLPNWFIRKRGLAIGIAFAGVGIGSVTMLPWVQWMIETSGWRTRLRRDGAAGARVLAPINLLLRKRPEDMGLQPDGDGVQDASTAPVSNVVDPAWAAVDWTLGAGDAHRAVLVDRRRFFLRAVCLVRGAGASDQISARYRLQPGVAAWALGLVSLRRRARPDLSRPFVGSDRPRMGLVHQRHRLCDLLCDADPAWRMMPSLALVGVMVLAQGVLGYGCTSIMGAVVLEIFQGKHYGSIFGTLMLAALAGGAAGPWLTGRAARSLSALTRSLSRSASSSACSAH